MMSVRLDWSSIMICRESSRIILRGSFILSFLFSSPLFALRDEGDEFE